MCDLLPFMGYAADYVVLLTNSRKNAALIQRRRRARFLNIITGW